MATVSVVIPTHNRLATLRRTIAGYLRHASRTPFELIVVDDGSSDGTWEYLTAQAAGDPRLRPARQEHAGPARARNRAIAQAAGRFLLLAGDDVRPAEGLVDGHVAALTAPRAPRFVLGRTEWDPERPITPAMRHVTGFGGQQFRYAYLRDGQRLGFRYFYASNLSLRRDELDAVGEPFDPAFDGAAFEDTDLGYRLIGRRAEIAYRSGLLAYHDHPYTPAGFAERQRRVGRATKPLLAKHPELAPLFGLRPIDAAIEAAAGAASGGGDGDGLAEAERLLGVALAPLEAGGGRALDRVWLGLFWYWYARGVLEWRAGDRERPAACAELFSRALRCPLRALASTGEADRDALRRLLELCAVLGRPRTPSRTMLECAWWRMRMLARGLQHRLLGSR